MHRQGLLVTALAGVAVVLVLLVCGAAARSGPWASAHRHATPNSAQIPSTSRGPGPDTDTSTPAAVNRGAGPGLSFVVYMLAAFTLLLAVLGLLLLSDLVHLPAWRRRSRQLVSSETETAEGVADDGEEALQTAVQRALQEFADQPDAREAVVRAWLLLGEAAAVAGTPRRPAESAREYARRLGHVHRLPTESLERLAALYREARFSDHEMLPLQREIARSELFALQTALADNVDLVEFQ